MASPARPNPGVTAVVSPGMSGQTTAGKRAPMLVKWPCPNRLSGKLAPAGGSGSGESWFEPRRGNGQGENPLGFFLPSSYGTLSEPWSSECGRHEPRRPERRSPCRKLSSPLGFPDGGLRVASSRSAWHWPRPHNGPREVPGRSDTRDRRGSNGLARWSGPAYASIASREIHSDSGRKWTWAPSRRRNICTPRFPGTA
jgi:hypothetical protein